MKTNQEKKAITQKDAEKRQIVEQGKQQLIEFLLHGPEQRVENRFSNKSLDRENEIIKLLGGGEVSIRKVKVDNL